MGRASFGDGGRRSTRNLPATGYAAAPVVDATGQLLGVLSEHDCIRVLTAAIAAMMLLYRPRRTLKWVGRAVTLYSFGRKLFSTFARR